jgi:hypothetical protein
MPSTLGAAHWRERAKEALLLADQVGDPESRATMLEIARDYEKLAARAEEREKRQPPKTG